MGKPDGINVEQLYRARTPNSAQHFEEALKVLPGGVTHSSRYWPPYPLYIDRMSGSRMHDVDGNEYIDYWLANGTMFMGHANPKVKAAIAAVLDRGTHFGLSHDLIPKLAAKVIELVPSAELVRFTNSGTEASAHAVRLARAYTGKRKILRFEGTFHGVIDELYVGVRPPFTAGDCAGIPASAYEHMLICPYNDLERASELVRAHRDDLAGVILEPLSGVIPAESAFLRGLRDLTNELGALLIYDEIVTGFRVAPGGAQELFGIIPDITLLGKVLGGGLPIGAVAGRREVMALVDPKLPADRRVDIAGTYAGNVAVLAAGLATLEQLADGQPQKHANALGARMARGLGEIIARTGEKASVNHYGCIFQIYFGLDKPPLNHREQARGSAAQLRQFHLALMTQGVFFKYGAEGRISGVHSEKDIDESLNRMEHVIK
ncbi:MAG: aspartate aminotransferase family protein, partial [Burkholderiales bacterium]